MCAKACACARVCVFVQNCKLGHLCTFAHGSQTMYVFVHGYVIQVKGACACAIVAMPPSEKRFWQRVPLVMLIWCRARHWTSPHTHGAASQPWQPAWARKLHSLRNASELVERPLRRPIYHNWPTRSCTPWLGLQCSMSCIHTQVVTRSANSTDPQDHYSIHLAQHEWGATEAAIPHTAKNWGDE